MKLTTLFGTALAIVALDICLLPVARADVLRRRIGEAIGAPAANVLVNFSHTHSAPAFPGWQPEPPDQARLQEQYWELLAERTVQSAAEARAQLRPARVAAGWGESRIGINRREVGPDGLIFLGEVPDGETDPAVGVIRVDDLALVGLSAEAFSGTGIEIKQRSPIALTNVLGYSNGCVMYLPREQDYPPGGWDVHVRYKIPDMLFQNYLVPVAFRPDSERRVVETALGLLHALA